MKRMMILALLAVFLLSILGPTALALEVCYPTSIDQSDDGSEIRKTYDLGPEDDPGGIPRSDFEQNGWNYSLTDLLKQETPEYQEREYSETVTVTSKNKDMESVLALLPQEKEFVTEDGLSGTLTLQLSTVRVETAGLDCSVWTDGKWAAFILGQLLQNAARYRGDEPVISIFARSLGKQVRLTVADNGMGIPAHELPRVFDRGFTGSNGRVRGGSTGMGLYLCKKLAGFLELGLEITSEEGKGTTVTLTFPAKEKLSKL